MKSAFLCHNNDAGCLLQMPTIGHNATLEMPDNCYLLADKAYVNRHPFIVPYRRHEFVGVAPREMRRRRKFNRALSAKRVYVEHLIKELQTYRVIGTLLRHPRWQLENLVELCAGLAQRRLEFFESV